MKRFEIITEADARSLAPGETVVLAPRGHITPLAQDTLRERRVTVVGEDASRTPTRRWRRSPRSGRWPSPAITPASRCGSRLMAFLRGRGLAVQDLGTDGSDPVDYPDVAASVARPVARGEADAGIVIDGAGIGSAIAANKIDGVRAVMATNETDRAVFPRAQRRQRPDARRHAGDPGRGAGDRHDLADDADARAALHPAAGEDPGPGADTVTAATVTTEDELQRSDRHHRRRRLARGRRRRRGGSAPATAVSSDCCPDRLRGVIDAGATRVGVHAAGGAPAEVASMIDHTLLKPDATRQNIDDLCREAAQFKFATVCVNPDLGRHAARSCCRGPAWACARSSGFRWARRRATSRATRRGARSSTARARSTW